MTSNDCPIHTLQVSTTQYLLDTLNSLHGLSLIQTSLQLRIYIISWFFSLPFFLYKYIPISLWSAPSRKIHQYICSTPYQTVSHFTVLWNLIFQGLQFFLDLIWNTRISQSYKILDTTVPSNIPVISFTGRNLSLQNVLTTFKILLVPLPIIQDHLSTTYILLSL